MSAVTPHEPADAGPTLPDPKRMVALFERLLEGNRALASGAPATRRTHRARGAGARIPATRSRGCCWGAPRLRTGQNREAIAAFKAYLDAGAAAAPTRITGWRWRSCASAIARAPWRKRRRRWRSTRGTRRRSRCGRGCCSRAAGRDEGIAAAARAPREGDPSNAALRLELADLLTDAGRFAEAEAEYRRVIAARPGDSRALLGLGLVLRRHRAPDEAIDRFNARVEADRANDEARFARAEVAGEDGARRRGARRLRVGGGARRRGRIFGRWRLARCERDEVGESGDLVMW